MIDSIFPINCKSSPLEAWSGGEMVLRKLLVPGCPTSLDNSRARAYCACSRCGWGLFGLFSLSSTISLLFSPSLWETARYGLKYCLKGPSNPKQPTIQPTGSTCSPSTDARTPLEKLSPLYVCVCVIQFSLRRSPSGSAVRNHGRTHMAPCFCPRHVCNVFACTCTVLPV